jgi:hypothetical protein
MLSAPTISFIAALAIPQREVPNHSIGGYFILSDIDKANQQLFWQLLFALRQVDVTVEVARDKDEWEHNYFRPMPSN